MKVASLSASCLFASSVLVASVLVASVLALSPIQAAWAAQSGAGGKLYRYKDDKGVLVLDQKVPPRFVANGYEVLNFSGRVLQVVPPQLSGKELAEKQRREKQAEEDRKLLKRYNSVADIESARSRKLAIVEQDMAIMHSNIANLGQQIEQEQEAAARTQRNGREVAPELLTRIDDLREEVSVLEERLERREKEALQINEEFDSAASRYAEISP